jgi:hypothetical protein
MAIDQVSEARESGTLLHGERQVLEMMATHRVCRANRICSSSIRLRSAFGTG